MSEPLSIGRFLVRQSQVTANTAMTAIYDLVICAVSWESRNPTSLQTIGGTNYPTVFVRFASSKPATDDAKDANLAILQELCPNNQLLMLGRSTELDANIASLQAMVRDQFVRHKRPLRILLDITCLPKSYVSFLCGLGFNEDYLCRLDCLYAAGHYDLTGDASGGGPLSIVSEGEWTSIQIPFLESANTFSPVRDLVVILGGEIGYSLPFIDRYEPARLSVVFIEDGVAPDKLTGSEKAAYEDLTNQPTLVRADFKINDMIGVLGHVHDFCSKDPTRAIVGLAIGSKAQSLALALGALDLDNLEVVCRIPSSYASKDVAPTGQVFLYSIEDRFEPMGYLDAH